MGSTQRQDVIYTYTLCLLRLTLCSAYGRRGLPSYARTALPSQRRTILMVSDAPAYEVRVLREKSVLIHLTINSDYYCMKLLKLHTTVN